MFNNFLKITFSFFLLIFSISKSTAQINEKDTANYPYWIQMMQDPDANFFQTQKAFYKYWENREIQKGAGYKPFKRWESYMETRVSPTGVKPAPDAVWNAYQKAKNGSAFQSVAGNWMELGPDVLPLRNTPWQQANGVGRVNCFGFHPTNSNLFYLGAPSGGFWKTTDGGITWTSNTDTLPSLGVSSIVVHYQNPDTIFMGTGDRDGNDAPGLGVMRSTDGANTWHFWKNGMGNRTVGDLLMHPTIPDVMLAATSGGIYKTTNGGQNWNRTSSNSRHYKDLEYKPTDPNIVYATADGDFYRSANGGDSWSLVTSGLFPNASRLVIGVTPDDANYVYVLAADGSVFGGMYRSTNSGQTFSQRSNTPNIMDYNWQGSGTSGQAWYDLAIAIDPQNKDIVYTGGVNIFKSIDGGQTWNINGHWVGGANNGNSQQVHADIHDLVFSPVNDKLYAGSDGGVYETSNGGIQWTDMSDGGLGIGQIYRIGQSPSSRDLVICGYQDNGTGMFKQGNWSTVLGADGMECAFDPIDTNFVYCTTQNGNIYRSDTYGANMGNIVSSINEDGAWITPYLVQQNNGNIMFIGLENVWRTTNVKTSSRNNINWTKLTNHTNTDKVQRVEQSQADENILYYTRSRNFYRTDNAQAGTVVFTDLTPNLPRPSRPIDIETHPTNANIVYIILSGKIYKSINKGNSWTNITGNLPQTSLNCLVYDRTSPEGIYVGTDFGVFYKDSTMANWTFFGKGLPVSVEVTELEIFYDQLGRANSRIRAGTYGRGLWESDLFSPSTVAPLADFNVRETVSCPNYPMYFSDNSSNIPNAWQWSFTPNTMTFLQGTNANSPNPIVAFNNVGTYQVELVSSNGNGSDTIQKSNYVNIISGQNVPFTEDFEGILVFKQSQDDDIDWTVNSGRTPSGTTGPTGNHTPGGSNYIYTEASGSNNNSLAIVETQCFNISAMNDPHLDFWYHMRGPQMGTLYFDLDTGVNNWINLWQLSGDQGNTWFHDSVSLNAFKGKDLRLRIRGFTGTNYQSDIAVDDVRIYDILQANDDVGITGFDKQSACNMQDDVVRIYLQNFSLNSISNIPFCVSVNGGMNVCDTFRLNLNAGQNILTSTPLNIPFSNPGTYNIQAFTAFPSDADLTNDTLVKTISSFPSPTILINPTNPQINSGDSVQLNASGGISYQWFPTNGLSQSIGGTVWAFPDSTRIYQIIGTDANGCQDTGFVEVIVKPVSIYKNAFGSASIKLFPNPTNGNATLQIENLEAKRLTIKVLDVLGRKISEEILLNNSQLILKNLELQNQSKGVYFIELSDGKQKISLRLVKF